MVQEIFGKILVHCLYHKIGQHKVETIIDEVNVKHENYSYALYIFGYYTVNTEMIKCIIYLCIINAQGFAIRKKQLIHFLYNIV